MSIEANESEGHEMATDREMMEMNQEMDGWMDLEAMFRDFDEMEKNRFDLGECGI